MNEGKIAKFGSIVGFLLNFLGVYSVIIVILWFIKGSEWLQKSILPLHGFLFFLLLIFTFLILIPLMVFKSIRPYSGILLYNLTYVYGGIAWFYSAHYCLIFLGKFWMIIGMLFLGIGVAPVAVIGSIIKGHWGFLIFICVQLIATFGCRFLAAYAVSTSE